MKRIINLGIQDYVADLYKDGEISIRDAAEILQLNFRQTFKILEKKQKIANNSACEAV